MPFFTRRSPRGGQDASRNHSDARRSSSLSNSTSNTVPASAGLLHSTGHPGMAAAFVPNKRRVRFDLTLRIIDLNNVPLVSGSSFVKWHLPSSTAAEHRGSTNKCAIRDHRVAYEYEKRVAVRLTVGKDGMLQECVVALEVQQEYSAAGRGSRIRLGEVKLNLAEYVEASERQASASPTSGAGGAGVNGNGGGEEGEGIVRRYLMQDSKINSTLKIGIYMRYLEGTREYIAPSLRTAPVFGGIAGIISSSEPVSTTHGVASQDFEAARDAASSNVPNLSRANRELGEAQDMYRRTLAAYLFSAPGELKADEAVEDIFAGGDGWGKTGRPRSSGVGVGHSAQHEVLNSGMASEGQTSNHHRRDGGGDVIPGKASNYMGHTGRGFRGNGGRYKHGSSHHSKGKVLPKGKGEIDELYALDNLRTWNVGQTAAT